jgi:hypothetical protein
MKKLKNRYYPAMFCLGEGIYIGVSYRTMRFANGKPVDKVNSEYWLPENCKFRSKEHVIDLSNCVIGKEIRCNKCGSRIDFRLWLSSTRPELIDTNAEDSYPKEFSDT